MNNEANNIATELIEKINNLVADESFRTMVADFAKKMGVTAEQWNSDAKLRTGFYGKFAMDYLELSNQI